MRRSLVAILLVLGALLPQPALAAVPTFGTPSGSSTFLTGISFEQPLDLGLAAGTTVEIVIDQFGSKTSFVALVPALAGDTALHYGLELPSGAAVPGTRFTARWRLTPPDGEPELGPPVSVVYADDRFEWKAVSGDVVRMHWYDGDASFGREALAIAEEGVEKAATLLGVDERDPIDFYIYADVAPFYDALGPASRENVGGVAYSDVRTMLANIEPSGIDDSWIRTVIPHELMHIVFASAVDNPYHFPPKWLNEGLAVYESEGYRSDRRSSVDEAVRDETLMPLTALVGQFPTSFERFVLAYAESVSAVDYLVRTYGQEKLVALIRSYQDGVSDDAAFDAALGVDVAGFEAGWLSDLGAAAPKAVGPLPDPPGPVPPGWDAVPSPGPSVGPSGEPAPTPTASGVEQPGAGGAAFDYRVALLGVVTIVAIVMGAIWWGRRRRT
jgi:hypothetical protein